MGTIINLYVLPVRRPSLGAVRATIAALVSEELLSFPSVIGPALLDGSLLDPQAVSPGYAPTGFLAAASEHSSLDSLDAKIAASAEQPSVLIAFPGLNQQHPRIASDFSHYRGFECAVGFYFFSAGHRLVIENEFVAHPLWDADTHAWIHLQGKAAPWKDLFRESFMASIIKEHFGKVQLMESDWA